MNFETNKYLWVDPDILDDYKLTDVPIKEFMKALNSKENLVVKNVEIQGILTNDGNLHYRTFPCEDCDLYVVYVEDENLRNISQFILDNGYSHGNVINNHLIFNLERGREIQVGNWICQNGTIKLNADL